MPARQHCVASVHKYKPPNSRRSQRY